MPTPGWMKTEDTIIQFLMQNEGWRSVREIAEAVHLSTSSINQVAYYLYGKKRLTRRQVGPMPGGKYVYQIVKE